MAPDDLILIVGDNEIFDVSLTRKLKSKGFVNVISSTEAGLNPAIQPSVYSFFQDERPQYVFFSSTRSGGIQANIDRGGEFLYHNTESQNNIFYAAHKFGTKKLLYLGATCVYPRDCPQPIREDALLTGPLEKTSEPYALAKIAGLKLCETFRRQYRLNAIAMIPATMYGPGLNLDENSHVMGALIGKFLEAKRANCREVVVWGSGDARREFIYIDDVIDAALHLMATYDDEQYLNVGSGSDVSIRELAQTIARAVGFDGTITFDRSRPDGTPRKLLDSSLMRRTGCPVKVSLEDGIKRTVESLTESGVRI